MADKSLFAEHKAELDIIWRDFRDTRGEDGQWTRLLRRRYPVTLEPELTRYVTGVDIESPILETEAVQRTQILTLQPAKVDVIAQEDKQPARDDAEDVRIYFASQMMYLDEDMRVSRANSSAQITKGLAVWRIRHHILEEPEDESADRDAYFKSKSGPHISLHRVPIGSVAFMPLDNPTVVVEESLVSYLEWRKMEREGKFLTLDAAGKVLFVGEAMQADVGTEGSKKMRVCTHAYQVPDSEDWKVCEWVYPDGGDVHDGEVWQEYDSPLGCPYEFCSSGDEMPGESNPHYRFRPNLYGLYTLINEQNYWLTRLASLAIEHSSSRNWYVNLTGLNPQIAAAIEGLGVSIEGSGAERRWILNPVDKAPGEIAISPQIEALPSQIPEGMIFRIQQLEAEIQALKTNRFLSGNATPAEVAQGTGSAIIGQTQQAALPFSSHLAKQASFWKRIFRKIQAMILYFDEEAEKDIYKRYYVQASGLEPVAKGDVKPGLVAYVDADKARRQFEILVYMSNITDLERAQKNAQAYADYDRATITFSQLLDRLGFEDPGKQIRELNRERHLVEARAQFAPVEAREREVIWTAMTGINLGQPPQGVTPQLGIGGSPPAPSPSPLPNMRPTISTPTSSPQGMSSPMQGAIT